MDWLQILATDNYWLEGLFLGCSPYLLFGQWWFALAWFVAWLFVASSGSVAYTSFALFIMLVFISVKVRGLMHITAMRGSKRI